MSFEPERLVRHRMAKADVLALVEAVLREVGFLPFLPGLWVGASETDAVGAVLGRQSLVNDFAWFASCLRAARLLRIEEHGDLTIALK